jgi:DNA-directed RNA polymerase I subunit RPA49
VSLPSNLEFKSFTKKSPDGTTSLILHSSSHPTIDFKAVEGASNTDKYLKHYVAVFDPAGNTLQVTEAKKLTMRSCVRRREPEFDGDEAETQSKPAANYSSRAALTHAFGTKKSKKAVQAAAENRLLAQGGDDDDDTNNPLSAAILSSMPSPEPVKVMSASPPFPVPNLATKDINEVYSLSSLIVPSPHSSTLGEMPISYWRQTAAKKSPIMSSSRFISSRVAYLVSALEADPSNPSTLLKVQLLRYILLLIELYIYLSRLPRGKRIPPVQAWPANTISGNISHEILNQLTKHFVPGGAGLGKNQAILLQSTILALTLHIPPPSLNAGANLLVTEPTDIQLDLAMKAEAVRMLYKQLGCKMESAKPNELERWGLQKKESMKKDGMKKDGQAATPKSRFAKLTIPLQFPTVSLGRSSKGRR